MGKGSKTTTVSQTYDPVASAKMAEIAERQQVMAEEQWDMYKDYFQEYEIAAAEANVDLLPHITAVSKRLYEESLEGVDVEKRADEAGANVISALRSERGTLTREMSRYGIDPGSSRFKSSLSETGTRAAEMTAAARNKATVDAERENYTRLGASLGLRSFAEGTQADPLGRAQAGYGGAAATYAPLASRVLSSTRTEPKADFWDFAASTLSEAAGTYVGKRF